MNPDLERLQPYPFEKLAGLLADVQPQADLAPISLTIGEPKHPVPDLILEAYQQSLGSISQYPSTQGKPELRQAIAGWLCRRFDLNPSRLDPESQVLPVSGTREALFAFAQAVIDRQQQPLVLMPNPCYQIYEGAALLAGATPHYLPCVRETGFLPDFNAVSAEIWQRCQLLYLCSPGNPTGAVMPLAELKALIELAHRHDFIIASDECYSEIYTDEAAPPPGLLQAAAEMGLEDFRRCVVFHSLSKRSNVPGMRSGFVAGDAGILKAYRQYRTYHGCTLSHAVQSASIAAWNDELHVQENRALYRQKFDGFLAIAGDALNCRAPAGSFYLWPELPVDDQAFTRDLLKTQNLRVVPGSFLSRDFGNCNPGRRHIRISLVASVEECAQAAHRIRTCLTDMHG